jgi:hypothetical protein
MRPSVRLYLPFISLLLCLSVRLQAQTTFPSAEGERVKYSAYIEMPKGYVSGICVLLKEEGEVKGSLFNEFGFTAIDFTYNPERDKIKLHSVMKMMDKWYIRKVLKKDLRQVMKALMKGESEYTNQRQHIVYRFHGIEE